MTSSRVYRAHASRPRRSGESEYRFTQNQNAFADRSPVLAAEEATVELPDRDDTREPAGVEHGSTLAAFLRLLSPGVEVVVQYDCQPASFGIFQGLRDGNLLLTDYNGYPGLVRLDVRRVNAVSVF